MSTTSPTTESAEAGAVRVDPAQAVAESIHADAGLVRTGAQELRLEPELRKALEAILLVVDEPVPVETLAQVLEVGAGDVEDGLISLAAEYVEQGRGFVLRRVGGGWRMYTDPGAAHYVEQFVMHGRSGRQSQAALETLAIVAYKQPVTRAAISEIRGVDADSGVRKLVSRGLIEEIGRQDSPGQPLLYGTSNSFLEKLGLENLDDLPALPDLSPQGPPPPEPAPGGYKAARRELTMLADEDDAISVARRMPDADEVAEDEEIERLLNLPTPKPGARLTALLDDPYGDEADSRQADAEQADVHDEAAADTMSGDADLDAPVSEETPDES